MTLENQRGITLTELLIASFLLGVVSLALVVLFNKGAVYFRSMSVRQKTGVDARVAMDQVTQALRRSRASTMRITTPNVANAPPQSRIDVEVAQPLTSGTTAYALYWENREVRLVEYAPAHGGAGAPKTLASNVTGFFFTCDSRDPTVVRVTLVIDAPLDGSGRPDRRVRVLLPNQQIQLIN